MKTRAAVAWKSGAPLTIETVDLAGPKAGEVLVEVKGLMPDSTTRFSIDGKPIFHGCGRTHAAIQCAAKSSALLRSPVFSRTPGNGSSAKRRVISLMIEVVSYGVLST